MNWYKSLLKKEFIHPIIYITIAWIVYNIIKRSVILFIQNKQKDLEKNSYNYKKLETLKSLIINFAKVLILCFTALAVLTVFGLNVSSILAGLGIASTVIALAFQDVIKDLIGGVTIILDNQFAIGDIVEIGNFKGEVLKIGLKTTRIRSYTGEIKIIANRNITELINYSKSYSRAIVDVSVSYEEDVKQVEKILTELADELSEELPSLKSKVELLGIDNLAESAIVFKLTAKTSSMEHVKVQRLIKKAVIERLNSKNIKIPYNQIEVHNAK